VGRHLAVTPRTIGDRPAVAKGGLEMEVKNVKCFGCHQKGHVVSDCPDKKPKKPAS